MVPVSAVHTSINQHSVESKKRGKIQFSSPNYPRVTRCNPNYHQILYILHLIIISLQNELFDNNIFNIGKKSQKYYHHFN